MELCKYYMKVPLPGLVVSYTTWLYTYQVIKLLWTSTGLLTPKAAKSQGICYRKSTFFLCLCGWSVCTPQTDSREKSGNFEIASHKKYTLIVPWILSGFVSINRDLRGDVPSPSHLGKVYPIFLPFYLLFSSFGSFIPNFWPKISTVVSYLHMYKQSYQTKGMI